MSTPEIDRLEELLPSLTPLQRTSVEAQIRWLRMARPNQLRPNNDWRLWLILAGRGFGKLIPTWERIPTPSGWTTMGDLKVGDQVFDENGKPCNVIWKSDVQRDKAYKLTFSDGEEIIACAEHQWVTWTHAERKAFLRSPYEDTTRFPDDWPQWRLRKARGRQLSKDVVEKALALHGQGVSLRGIEKRLGVCRASLSRHIKAGRYVERAADVRGDSPGPRIRNTQEIVDTFTYGKRGDLNHCIPVTAPLAMPERELPLDPWVLGYYLGNGRKGQITCDGRDRDYVMGRFAQAGFKCAPSRETGLEFYARGLVQVLTGMGLKHDKFIPPEYLRASPRQRMELLQGLFDSDGHPETQSFASFCNTNRRLIDGCYELIVSLGAYATVGFKQGRLNGVDKKPAWNVYVTCRPDFVVFSSPRKRTKLKFTDGQALRKRHRMIVAYELLDCNPEMQCITVDSPNSMYLVGKGMIPTHNTRTGAEKVREWATFYDGMRIGLMGPTTRDTQKTMIEGESGLLSIIPEEMVMGYNQKSLEIKLKNGSLIQGFTAEEPERLRGPQFHRFWLDEPAAMPRLKDVKDQIAFSVRLKHERAVRTQQVWTTTPRPKPIIRELVKESKDPGSGVVVTIGSSYENKVNLDPEFFKQLMKEYEGTTLGRQEIHAELIDAAEHGIMKKAWLKLWPNSWSMPRFLMILLSLDTAYTIKTENDPTAGSVWGVFRHPQTGEIGVMLLGAWREWLAYPDLREKVIRLMSTPFGDLENRKGMRPTLALIEEKGSGITLIQDLKRARVPIRAYNPGHADKISRAHVTAPMVRDGRVFIMESEKKEGEPVEWAREFIEEITCFPEVEHDDYTDTFTQMLAMVRDLDYIQPEGQADEPVHDDDEDDDYAPAVTSSFLSGNFYLK